VTFPPLACSSFAAYLARFNEAAAVRPRKSPITYAMWCERNGLLQIGAV
jgi:hypothetical protein